jgi:hypothetical protein
MDELPPNTSFDKYEACGIWDIDRYQNVIVSRLVEDTGIKYDENDQPVEDQPKSRKKQRRKHKEQKISPELRDQIIKVLNSLCSHGILAQEPLSELKISLGGRRCQLF